MIRDQIVFTQAKSRELLKTQIRALRTIWWYRVVADQLGVFAPHQVGRLATPDHYRIDGIAHKYRTDWPLYARGARSPSGLTLEQVDRLVPGSTKVYCNPLWAVLLRSRQSERGWQQLARSGPVAVSELLNRDLKVGLKAAAAKPVLDIMLSLLALRRCREAAGKSIGCEDLDRLLIKVCLVAAAQDRIGLPFPGLIKILNLYFWAQDKQPYPFFPLSAFCHSVLTMRCCQPTGARAFEIASEEERRVIAVDAAIGKFGWDLFLASRPIYLCDCQRECEHLDAARRARRLISSGVRTIRGGLNCS